MSEVTRARLEGCEKNSAFEALLHALAIASWDIGTEKLCIQDKSCMKD